MPVSTPIATMTLQDARKSVLEQLQEYRRHLDMICGLNVDALPLEQVEFLARNTNIILDNINSTLDRITELERG